MKKVLIIAAIAGTALTTNAQFTKGDKFTSTSFSYSSKTKGDFTSSSFNLAPSVGYFVSNNWSLVLEFGIGSNLTDSSTGIDDLGNALPDVKFVDKSSFSFGAHANYFFTPAEKFSFFANIGIDYLSENNKIAKETTSGFGLSVVPSLSYFLNDRLAMQASYGSLGYHTMKSDAANAKAENNLGLNFDMSSIGFGMTYKF